MRKFTSVCLTTGSLLTAHLLGATESPTLSSIDLQANTNSIASSQRFAPWFGYSKKTSSVAAAETTKKKPASNQDTSSSVPDILLEVQAAYYYPTTSKFRDLYAPIGIYGVELSVQAYKDLYVWTSGSYLTRSGHSRGLHDKTTITMVPIGVGLKYLMTVDFLDFYLGAGVLPTYVHLHDHSAFVVQKSSKWGCGAIAKSGMIFNLPSSFFIDFFADYTYLKVNVNSGNPNNVIDDPARLSGFSFGGSIGYRFGSR